MAKTLAGSPTLPPDPLVAWVFGPKMQDYGDERRMDIARHLARHAWEFAVESCGGFALGVRGEGGQLGGLVLAIPRGNSGCITRQIERQTANYMAGKFPWSTLGNAKPGVNMRIKTFERMRRDFLARINIPHVYLSHVR